MKYPKGTNLSLPINEERAKTVMKAHPVVYNASMVTDEYRHFFEVGLGFWLSNGGNPNPGYSYHVFGTWMGGSMDPTARPFLQNERTKLVAIAQGNYLYSPLRYWRKENL